MADRRELNYFEATFDDASRNDRRNEERFARRGMENRGFFPSYRYRHSYLLCQPKPRRPLESYMNRLTLRGDVCNKQIIKIHDSSEILIQSCSCNKWLVANLCLTGSDKARCHVQSIQSKCTTIQSNNKCKNSRSKNLKEFLKKSTSTGFTKNYWLSQIKQAKNRLCLSSMSFSLKIVGVIINCIIVGIFIYMYMHI